MIIGHIILPKKKKKSQRYHKIILILDILITQVILFFFWVLIIGYLVLSSYIRQSSINYIFLHNIHVILSLLDSKTGQKYLQKKKKFSLCSIQRTVQTFLQKEKKKKKKRERMVQNVFILHRGQYVTCSWVQMNIVCLLIGLGVGLCCSILL